MEILFLVIGLAIGVAAGWLATKGTAGKSSERSKILEGNLAKLELELKEEINEKVELSNSLSQNTEVRRNLEQKLEEQKKDLNELQEKFKKEFENLANKILDEKTQKFTSQNREKLDEILKPFNEKIKDFEKKVEDTYVKGTRERSALVEQIKNLKDLNEQMSKDAVNLTKALKGDSKTQGNWGEIQLEIILEKAGLIKDLHYLKEENLKNEDGANQRLDFIINLPDDKHLILDSKVSLTAYERYFNAENEAESELQLKEHLQSIHGHIKLLSSKNYQKLHQINQPDYILMFLANEPALVLALKEDMGLFEKALEKNIVLVSSSTLLATLRTISYIWKQENQNKNALEIARQAGALFDKFSGFVEDLIDVGKKMDSGKKSYEAAMNKLCEGKGNLVRRSEEIRKLGAKTSKSLPENLVDRATEQSSLFEEK